MTEQTPILALYDVYRHFGPVRAVDGVSLTIHAGETLGIVGESGCGKSTLARLMLRLERPDDGRLEIDGRDAASLDAAEARRCRRDVQAVFQDPYSSLNPRMRLASTLTEPLTVHGIGTPAERRERAAQMLERVGLTPDGLTRYPHEFSGGQRQRIAIARALMLEPRLIVLDEPISALDVSIRAQVLNLLAELRDGFGTGYVFIAHDLAAVASISDRIAVMYLGEIVEHGSAEHVARSPRHPYTQMLFAAADPTVGQVPPKGEPPSPMAPPPGCRFHTRCPFAKPRCKTEAPKLSPFDGREVACHFAERISSSKGGPNHDYPH